MSPHVDDVLVAGITVSRGPKSDKCDAYALAEQLRVGSFDKVEEDRLAGLAALRAMSLHFDVLAEGAEGA